VSEANVELARRVFEAFAVRDLEALRGLMDENVEFLPVTANLTTGGVPYRGRDGIAAYFADVDRVWVAGDSVVVLGRIHARGGGMVIDRPTGWVWRMRDGKILSGRVYASHEEALKDVGLEDG
jgi:ketosteroid isomerase-like protein